MSGDNAALPGVNEKPMMDRQNHHGNDNLISGVVKDDGNNMNMRNVNIMSSHNNLNSVGTSANNFTSTPPRFVSKNVRLPSLGSPRMNHRMRSRRFDGETVPLTQILQALPMKVVVMGDAGSADARLGRACHRWSTSRETLSRRRECPGLRPLY